MPVDTSGPGYLAGEYPGGKTTVNGVPQAATVKVFYELGSGDWQLAGETVSSIAGAWMVTGVDPDKRFQVLGRLAGYNDVILANVQPVPLNTITPDGQFSSAPAFNALSGSIELYGGVPPYTVSVHESTAPGGLSFYVDGRDLKADGTSTNEGYLSFTLKVESANGASALIPVVAEFGLHAPTNLKAEYIED